MHFEKIVSIKPVGIKPSIDITVDSDNHLFYANGIITSNSHGIGYGMMGYWAAYAKAHFPMHFYTAWLFYSHEKMKPQQEMRQLITDARFFDITISPPSLTQLYNGDVGHFSMTKDAVYFGVGDIKKIGESHVGRLLTNVKEMETLRGQTIDKWTWYDFLIFFSDTISQTVVNGIVAAGATDYMSGSRSDKLHEYEEWHKLTQKERDWIKENGSHQTLLQAVRFLLSHKPKLSVPRRKKIEDMVKVLEKPSFSVKDDAYFISAYEYELLGVPVTCSKLDTCNNTIQANTTCKEFLQGKEGNLSICVEIMTVRESIIKKGQSKGQKMLYLSVEDDTGSIDSVIAFPNVLHGFEPILIEGGTVVLEGTRDKKTKDSFIITKIVAI